MSTEQIYTSSAGWWVVEYPTDWCVDESEDPVTFYRPEIGVCALQISSFRTPGQQDTRQVLSEYLSDQDVPVSETTIGVQQDGPKTVCSCNYLAGDTYWHVWVISQGSQLLFVTYNCEVADKGQELDRVLGIISSVRILEQS